MSKVLYLDGEDGSPKIFFSQELIKQLKWEEGNLIRTTKKEGQNIFTLYKDRSRTKAGSRRLRREKYYKQPFLVLPLMHRLKNNSGIPVECSFVLNKKAVPPKILVTLPEN